MRSDSDVLYLCNFDIQLDSSDSVTLTNLWAGQWSLEETNLYKEIITDGVDTDTITNKLKNGQYDSKILSKILEMAISSFLTFCERNWNPHPEELNLDKYFDIQWPKNIDASVHLQRDSEPLYTNILFPELLYFSSQIFSALYSFEQSLVHLWWCFRSKVTHQRVLEDTSATLYNELELTMAKLYNESQTLEDNRLKILLYSEIAQAYLIYGRVQKVDEYLSKATELAGLKLELTGVLNKK